MDELHEIGMDEIAELVVQVAMRWIAAAFAAGVIVGLAIGILM